MITLFSCNKKNSEGPSIKDHSNKFNNEVLKKDYSNEDPMALYKHALAHFDLEQYETGLEKLKYIIDNRKDLADSLDLMTLKEQFESKLIEIKQKEDAVEERNRKERLPNVMQNIIETKTSKLSYFVDKSTPKFDSRETFHAYVTKSNTGAVKLKLKIKYIATEWLDIESFLITVDQLDYEFKGVVEKTETKGKKKYKVETFDEVIDTLEELNALEAIANGNDVKAVYVGKNTYKERLVNKEQQEAIRNVLDAFLFIMDKDMTYIKSRLK